MEKTEYLKLKEAIIQRLGKPEYDNFEPVNESAKEIDKLKKAHKSELMKEQKAQKKLALSQEEEKEVVKKYRHTQATPIDLSEADLEPFTDLERQVIIDYFRDTNLTPTELARSHFSRQKVVALLRSGPFQVLAARVYEHLGPLKTRWAVLKALDAGEKTIVQRAAEQWGIFKNQEMNLNINKPIDNPELIQKLKEMGDSI